MTEKLRLGVNIDHVATIRNARGGSHPDPVRAALLAAQAGADGITAHLREDRRHIRDEDIVRLKTEVALPLNLEMAATEEMLKIALTAKPHAACIVPEKRQELTTEGGLDVVGGMKQLKPMIGRLKEAGIRVSLFIDANPKQIEAAQEAGADIVELHTGRYAEQCMPSSCGSTAGSSKAGKMDPAIESQGDVPGELSRLIEGARMADFIGLEVHAGHGLSFDNVTPIAAIPQVVELNIGHFLIGEAIFTGIEDSIKRMRLLMDEARA